MVVPSGAVYEFGEFRLDTGKHRLLRGDQAVALTPKAIETLRVLIENRGALVERDALMAAVWPDVVVEDGNLTVTISMIRKALGDDPNDRRFIETVPRLGYKFVADVRIVGEKPATGAEPIAPAPGGPPTVLTPAPSPRSRPGWPATGVAIAAVLLAAFALVYARPWSTPEPAGAGTIQSIAVLPLTSLSDVAEDRALGLGFADALMTSLAGVADVRVRSTHGVRDGEKAPAEIGQTLGVDAVLDGTLQRANGMLRVTLRLIRSSDGRQVWSDSFDEAEKEIFKLQDTMASQTAESLKWNLASDPGRRTNRRYTTNRDAYHAYLLGRMLFDKRQADDYPKAIGEFERAIALDPSYALAFTGLADVYAIQANTKNGPERAALYEKSRTMATKALALDETLAEAHTSLGWIKRIHDWDWAGSEAEFKRALELNPASANAHQWYALLLTTLGRTDEALKHGETARELEPLSSIILQNYLQIRTFRRDTEALPPIAEHIARLEEAQWMTTRARASVAAQARDYAKVIEIGDSYRSQGRQPPDTLVAHLAIAYSHTRQESQAKEMVARLEKKAADDSHAMYLLATVHAELGHPDDAIALLERAHAAHDDRMVWIKVEPRLDSLRDDKRFRALLRRMNL